MEKELRSKALEVNLAQTRDVEVQISEDHLWFLSLAENYYGIHKRIKEFFIEYHHPYSNTEVVVEQLNSVVLADYWLYQQHKEKDRAFQVVLVTFNNLLKKDLSGEEGKQLVYVFLVFLNNNFPVFQDKKELINRAIEILDTHLGNQSFSYISNLGFFFKSFRKISRHNEYSNSVLIFMKKLILENISFWEKTSSIEDWYEKNKSKLSGNYLDTLKQLGKPLFKAHHEKLEMASTFDDLSDSAFTFSDMVAASGKKPMI